MASTGDCCHRVVVDVIHRVAPPVGKSISLKSGVTQLMAPRVNVILPDRLFVGV
jgi:hypothetical protein